ncbi:MAG: hypothetical protein CME31_17885 [Gimesia sp.]|uniref:Uncharacterized protein n=1 Tax=Gimesia maris TaxID=122 RepID=A0A3D3RHE0_9PLAN|nr:hypothetical protein [Gimesia sp.]HCO27457.1 hypothetical protein [Gimesia maris]|tara:strand:+ start:37045 stop:37644 length:600 start_codon:yes stop_codon:yes gene_type:complete
MRFVSFHTKLFFTDIPDEQLDSWFIGGDCSGWFYARLIPYNQMEPDLEPTMEDWGWIMTVKTNGIAVDIYVWEYLERHNSWVFGIAAKNKWLRKIPAEQLDTSEDTVARAIGSNPGSRQPVHTDRVVIRKPIREETRTSRGKHPVKWIRHQLRQQCGEKMVPRYDTGSPAPLSVCFSSIKIATSNRTRGPCWRRFLSAM